MAQPHSAAVRAVGALVLLFGLQLQRIRHLTVGQVTEKDGNAYLTAGRRPVLLPPRLAAILRELAAQPPPRHMIPNRPDAPRWLFPGRIPGQPLDLHGLNNQLNRHGISARPARNGALAALASDLPAAVLADFLGIHVNTAVRWVTYARQDWTPITPASLPLSATRPVARPGVSVNLNYSLPASLTGVRFARTAGHGTSWRIWTAASSAIWPRPAGRGHNAAGAC